MKTKEKIIKRLNEGFGFEIPYDTPWMHHQKERYGGGTFSWSVAKGPIDIGSVCSMTECLKWERWIYSKSLHEIFEFIPNREEEYLKDRDVLIEDC